MVRFKIFKARKESQKSNRKMFHLDYITVFDTELNADDSSDTSKQLLLYHVFANKDHSALVTTPDFSFDNIINGTLLKARGNQLTNGKFLDLLQISDDGDSQDATFVDSNEKLGNVGMIQAMYSFYKQNFNSHTENKSVSNNDENKSSDNSHDIMTIKLSEGKVILVYNYETAISQSQKKQNIFIAISCNIESNLHLNILEKLLIKSIINFKFLYGPFELFYGKNIYFTGKLNEFYVSYWNNVQLMSENNFVTMSKFQPNMYKKSELQNVSEHNLHLFDQISARIKNEILLNEQYYLNVKDIMVYQYGEHDAANDGFLTNFSFDNKSISTISNWLQDLIEQKIKSRGNVSPVASGLPSNGIDGETNSYESEQFTQKVIHNITLPFQFAYDAVHEVGNMTGVGSSISMLGDLIPKMNNDTDTVKNSSIFNNNINTNEGNGTKHDQYGIFGNLDTLIRENQATTHFLKYFVENKFTTFVKFGQFHERRFNLLVWEYKTTYCVLLVESEFDVIYEDELLEELDEKLTDIFDTFNMKREGYIDSEEFNYYIENFQTSEVFSSIPDFWHEQKAQDISNSGTKITTSESSFLSKTTSMWGLSSIFGGVAASPTQGDNFMASDTESQTLLGNTSSNKSKSIYSTQNDLFHNIDKMQFDELNKFIWSTLLICNDEVEYERLIKLDNGVLCYVYYKKGHHLLLTIKNWLNESGLENANKKTLNRKAVKFKYDHSQFKLLRSLGLDVVEWWIRNQDFYIFADT